MYSAFFKPTPMCDVDHTPLTTKVLSEGQEKEIVLTKHKLWGTEKGEGHEASLYVDQKLVGYMKYSLAPDHLFISWMENKSCFKHVGTALHEFAFRESIKQGKHGHVELDASYSSHIFHYLNGFRPKSEQEKTFAFGLVGKELEKLCLAYLNETEPSKKQALQHEIENHAFYKRVLPQAEQIATQSLALPEARPLSFDEIVREGIFTYDTFMSEKLKNLLQSGHDNKNIDTSGYGSYIMYLPEEEISRKKSLYQLSDLPSFLSNKI